ncbi:DUF4429 domain-containing protein [Streptomyces sp. NPDC093085]|uniref:DUF4429 domain-containing protein n=1 Tax=Streptomyces sp. NPDC093085 TaxID=3155068 RepID=UPI00343CED71
MGDVLAGIHATWEFDDDSVLIRFERGIRTPRLLSALGERRIPHEALSSVTVGAGKRGTVVLRAVPRPGADPLTEAAAGQLRESVDPYRLVLPAEARPLAEYYAETLGAAVDAARTRRAGAGLVTDEQPGAGTPGHGTPGPDRSSGADEPAERFLVAAPEAPLSFKAYDAKASFDGRTVSFRWFRTGASSAKWKAGDQRLPVGELEGVEWHSPELFDGYLRLLPRGGPAESSGADHDPAAVVFGLGYGPVHESLPFAAAVLAAVRDAAATRVAAPVPALAPAGRRDPADVADRIRHLGELHQAGLVTDEEFTAKKTELLAEL